MKLSFFFIATLILSESGFNNLYSQQELSMDSDSVQQIELVNLTAYSIPDSVLNLFPFQSMNYLNRFYPGVVSYFQNFYIRGGENYETGYFIDGVKFNDLFTGNNSFFLNPGTYQSIDFYNGFIPADIGNTSSGLFNYDLRTGGDKLQFNAEYQTDNISFTDDAYSGEKRLGAFYYGYNETNLNFSGPLFTNNIRFFANANYLFQRDKNPQRYPGANNLFFYDSSSMESITLNLPAGIVPYNSFESINLLSTLYFEFDQIHIKASGIYFDEDSFVERNHILEYLNLRLGLIDRSGGMFNIKFDHKLNDMLAYSVNGNYYQKSEMTNDQYLEDDYWSYGDSIANAEAGVYWQREGNDFGRYNPPSDKHIMGWRFPSPGFPGIDHKKSEQEKYTLTGNVRFTLNNHLLRISGEFFQHRLRHWELINQAELAGEFYRFREISNYDDYNDEELRDFIAAIHGANNVGYDLDGDESNSELDKAPEPFFYSIYVDDQFVITRNLYLYIGLRYDYFDFYYKKMIDPAAPEKTFNPFTLEIIEEGLIDTKSYSFLSPKAYIKFSPLNNLSIVAEYSQNVQSHPYNNIFQGFNSIRYQIMDGFFSSYIIRTGELKPIVSSEYEIHISFSPMENLNTKLVYFNKHSENLSRIAIQEVNPASPFSDYYYYSDSSMLNIWGLDFILDYYREGFNLLTNVCYQYLNDEHYEDQFNTVRLNTFLSYNFYHLQNVSNVFYSLDLSVLFSFDSGHPYYVLEERSRYPGPYSGTTPNVYQFDLKLEKKFGFLENFELGMYLYVINVFDARNVYDVFYRTGSAENDGFDMKQQIMVYGEQYATLYNLINKYNPNDGQQTFYGPPRQIGFGIKLNF